MAKRTPPPPPETKKSKDHDKAHEKSHEKSKDKIKDKVKEKPKDKLIDKAKEKVAAKPIQKEKFPVKPLQKEKIAAKPLQKEKPQEVKRTTTPIPSPAVSAETKKPKDLPHAPPIDHDLFSTEEIEGFRATLVQEKKKLLQKAREALQSGNIQLDKNDMYDEVDLASATIEQNLTFRLLDRDRKLLGEIDHALFKIDSGEYGFCEGTGEPIPKRRLELRPWTRHSVKYKEHLEKLKKAGRLSPAEEEEAAAASAADQD